MQINVTITQSADICEQITGSVNWIIVLQAIRAVHRRGAAGAVAPQRKLIKLAIFILL